MQERPDDLVCRACGAVLAASLTRDPSVDLASTPAGEAHVRPGSYTVIEASLPGTPSGELVVHAVDADGSRRVDDATRLVGCCGPDGNWGRNRVCRCGAEVGTERSACWQAQGIFLAPGAVLVRRASGDGVRAKELVAAGTTAASGGSERPGTAPTSPPEVAPSLLDRGGSQAVDRGEDASAYGAPERDVRHHPVLDEQAESFVGTRARRLDADGHVFDRETLRGVPREDAPSSAPLDDGRLDASLAGARATLLERIEALASARDADLVLTPTPVVDDDATVARVGEAVGHVPEPRATIGHRRRKEGRAGPSGQGTGRAAGRVVLAAIVLIFALASGLFDDPSRILVVVLVAASLFAVARSVRAKLDGARRR